MYQRTLMPMYYNIGLTRKMLKIVCHVFVCILTNVKVVSRVCADVVIDQWFVEEGFRFYKNLCFYTEIYNKE